MSTQINSSNQTITQYQTQIGAANNNVSGVGPGTAEQPLVSQGAGSDPSFQVLNPAGGGTGRSSLTANNVLIGNGTSSISYAAPTSIGYVLTDNGVGADPTFQAIPGASEGFLSVNVQVFDANGTYTPTANMTYCVIECVGGGGGGGGAPITNASQYSHGGGGGAGEYARGVFTSTDIGASQIVTIGAGGAGNTGVAGSDGTATSVGALISANPGLKGSIGSGSVSTPSLSAGGLGGTGGTGGDLHVAGEPGLFGQNLTPTGSWSMGGSGGSSIFGGGGKNGFVSAGNPAVGYGSGGGGASNYQSTAATAGGAGSGGIVVITEYISGASGSSNIIGVISGDGTTVTPSSSLITLVDGNNCSSSSAAPHTITFDVTGTTQYAIQVGSAAGALTSLPLGTSGQTLISAGAGSNPSWGTLSVPAGGTGATTLTGLLSGNGTSPVTASSVTQYTVLLGDASNGVTNVSGTGTAGQVLTSQGAGANPQWAAPVGSWVLIGSQTASSSPYLDFTGLTSTYATYVVILDKVSASSATGTLLTLLVSNDNGSSFYLTDYQAGCATINMDSGSDTNASVTSMPLSGADSNIRSGVSGVLHMFGIGSAGNSIISGQVSWKASNVSDYISTGLISGINFSATSVDAIRFTYETGNIASGTIKIYGIIG